MIARRMPVQPSVLTWARESANIDLEEAAHRIGISAAYLKRWEVGDLDPTINQLRKAADVYTRPLSTFFLNEPVADERRFELPDFRRPGIEGKESPALRKAILRAKRQRDAIQEVSEEGAELPHRESNSLVISRTDTPSESGKKLRAALKLDPLPERIFGRPDELFRNLVHRVEQMGYLVIQVQRVAIDEMRGFSLSGGPMPVIAINGADWPRGKIFTLLHELVHVAMRNSGLCDLSRASTQPEERYCDEVAAAALMPKHLFKAQVAGIDTTSYASLRGVGDQFGTSAESVLIRLIHLDLATWNDYNSMKASFREAYTKHKQVEKDLQGDTDAPIYYQLKVRDLGRPFITTVLRAHDDGFLSSRDVTHLLEVSYDKLPKLAARLGGGVPTR
ncbi:MAG: ImmA/IrrE family metallo-endopeptidase [Cryobacterium sp.]|nr:ImmA/IrrE family metallo-endopeptidase [Cryobacterium sp.]